jgi:hypothetical protein
MEIQTVLFLGTKSLNKFFLDKENDSVLKIFPFSTNMSSFTRKGSSSKQTFSLPKKTEKQTWVPKTSAPAFKGSMGDIKGDSDQSEKDDEEDFTEEIKGIRSSRFNIPKKGETKITKDSEVKELSNEIRNLLVDRNKFDKELVECIKTGLSNHAKILSDKISKDLGKIIQQGEDMNENYIAAMRELIQRIPEDQDGKIGSLLEKYGEGIDASMKVIKENYTIKEIVKSWDETFEETGEIIILAPEGVDVDVRSGEFRRFHNIKELINGREGRKVKAGTDILQEENIEE